MEDMYTLTEMYTDSFRAACITLHKAAAVDDQITPKLSTTTVKVCLNVTSPSNFSIRVFPILYWISLITARKRSLGQGNMFTVFTGVCLSTAGCLVPGGCLLRGVPAPGGTCSGGCLLLGGCLLPEEGCLLQGGVPGGDPRGYCCGRYASYWNAFLLVGELGELN